MLRTTPIVLMHLECIWGDRFEPLNSSSTFLITRPQSKLLCQSNASFLYFLSKLKTYLDRYGKDDEGNPMDMNKAEFESHVDKVKMICIVLENEIHEGAAMSEEDGKGGRLRLGLSACRTNKAGEHHDCDK